MHDREEDNKKQLEKLELPYQNSQCRVGISK